MIKFRDGFVGPIIILTAIAIICTWAVAATFNATAPEIARVEAERAAGARMEVLPMADDFFEFTGYELPEGVASAFRATNGTGFVFQAFARGYGGNVPVMVGMDTQGNIVGIRVLSHSETRGLGDRIENPEYLALFYGLSSPDGVDGISGATVSVNALKNSLRSAAAAFEQFHDLEPGEAS